METTEITKKSLMITLCFGRPRIGGVGGGGDIHKGLKQLGRKIAQAKGFEEGQITEELPISFVYEGKERAKIFVDVAAISPNKSLAIEAGMVTPEKLIYLRLVFDEVIWLPYEFIPSPEALVKEIERLKWEKSRLEEDYKKICARADLQSPEVVSLKERLKRIRQVINE